MKTTDFINKYQESVDQQEYNDEAGMTKNSLHTVIRVATHLERELGDNENLPEWVQEKIAQIKGMMVSVMDYMISQHEMGKKDEVPTFTAESAEAEYNRLVNEDASAGATGSPSVAVSMQTLGEKGAFSRREVEKKLGSYTNQLSPGGVVKSTKAK